MSKKRISKSLDGEWRWEELMRTALQTSQSYQSSSVDVTIVEPQVCPSVDTRFEDEQDGNSSSESRALPSGYIALCCLLNLDYRYAQEWLVYHKYIVGIDHFYLYDNQRERNSVLPSDRGVMCAIDCVDAKELLSSFIEEGWVTFVPCTNGIDEPLAHCMKSYGHLHECVGFLDMGQFVVLNPDSDEERGGMVAGIGPLFKKHFEDIADCVSINVYRFGTCGHYFEPSGLVIEAFVRRKAAFEPFNRYFVRPRSFQGCHNLIGSSLKQGSRLATFGANPVQDCEQGSLVQANQPLLHVNDYVAKSLWSWIHLRLRRGCGTLHDLRSLFLESDQGSRGLAGNPHDTSPAGTAMRNKFVGPLECWRTYHSSIYNHTVDDRLLKHASEVAGIMERYNRYPSYHREIVSPEPTIFPEPSQWARGIPASSRSFKPHLAPDLLCRDESELLKWYIARQRSTTKSSSDSYWDKVISTMEIFFLFPELFSASASAALRFVVIEAPPQGTRDEVTKNQSDIQAALDRFDWRAYVSLNPDLPANGILDQQTATTHFLQYGIHEGRVTNYSDDRPDYR